MGAGFGVVCAMAVAKGVQSYITITTSKPKAPSRNHHRDYLRASEIERVNTFKPSVPVFMCTWKRPHLFQMTLRQLENQQGVNVRFHVWNNNVAIADELDHALKQERGGLAPMVIHSDRNEGSIARFHMARAHANGDAYVVFIDDDQEFGTDFLRRLWDERSPGGATASYARRIVKGKGYWQRDKLKPGDRANYCGPGGMIVATSCLHVDELIRIPPPYTAFDDLWFSYVMDHVLRAPMKKSSASVRMIDPANDTSIYRKDEKAAFLEYLRARGWDV